MKRLSVDYTLSHLAHNLWGRSRPVLSMGFKDCLMYLDYNTKVSQIATVEAGHLILQLGTWNLELYTILKAKVIKPQFTYFLEGFARWAPSSILINPDSPAN